MPRAIKYVERKEYTIKSHIAWKWASGEVDYNCMNQSRPNIKLQSNEGKA